MPRLTIQERGKDRAWTHECADEQVTIGRLDSNVIQLASHGVSRQHAKIIVEGGNFFLLDLKSGNGTFLNGLTLKPNEKNLLRSGDTITIENFEIGFHEGADALSAAIEEEITESDILEVKLLKKVLTALDKEMIPSIEVLNGAAEGKKMFLADDMTEMVIGRDPECDFPINEYVISRRHARIIKRWGGIAIRDLESKNGVFVNSRRVVEEYLHDGDRIALGTIVLMFRNPQEINLSAIEDIRPKNRPAKVRPDEIPGLEGEAPQVPEEAGKKAKDAVAEEAENLAEWDNLEKSLSGVAAYPTPQTRIESLKGLTRPEIGMIWLGTVIFIFALIAIIKLLAG